VVLQTKTLFSLVPNTGHSIYISPNPGTPPILIFSSPVFQGSRYSDSLPAGRSGDRIPPWREIFHTYPDRLRGPPSLLYNGYRVFPGGKGGRGVMLTKHPLLVPRLRKSSSTHPMGPPGPGTGFPLPLPLPVFHVIGMCWDSP
jgi:hypothetical protein